jgi:hypothetical protein
MDLIAERVGSSDVLLKAVFLLSSMLLPSLVSLKPTLQRQLIYTEQNNLHSKPIVETQTP